MIEKYPYSILFVEDEDAIRQNYVEYLKMIFDAVYEAKDGEEAYIMYKAKKPNIMIVDIHLPKVSGLEFLRKVRVSDHATKAIMLTAHTDTQMLLEATSLKLTKYLIKPVSRKALWESLQEAIGEIKHFETKPLKRISLDDTYSWDNECHELFYFEQSIALTKKEQQLLALLFSSVRRTFTYDEIFEYVWGYEQIGTIDALKSLVKTLRKKLPKESLQNVFGIGYKIHI